MNDPQLEQRLAAIEHQLRLVSDHLGIPCPPFPSEFGPPPGFAAGPTGGMPPDVVELARSGNAIGAIKRYREITGASLSEAKDAIDRI
jgi:hypothetical protein